jgi:hypothetical protein
VKLECELVAGFPLTMPLFRTIGRSSARRGTAWSVVVPGVDRRAELGWRPWRARAGSWDRDSGSGSTSQTTDRVSPPIGSAHWFEGGREVAQGGGLVHDPVAGELTGAAGDVLADLDDVVDVALRVGPPWDGQAHQVKSGRHL